MEKKFCPSEAIKKPRVSVIMPVHNEPELFLTAAINSILNQTFSDFELIIIDDASDEYVKTLVFKYNDKRIRYYKNKTNLKVIKTLNKGLSLARGEYIARMDADDISFRNRLQLQVEFLDNHPEIGLVNAQGYFLPSRKKITPPEAPEDISLFLKYSANCIIHPVVMFRKSLIDKYNLKYSLKHVHVEDYKLWLDLIKHTKLYTLQIPLLLHREWESSVSSKFKYTQYYNAQALIFECMLEDLSIKNKTLLKKFKNQFYESSISTSDFLLYDKIFHNILKKISSTKNISWKSYISQSVNNLRQSLFSKVSW